MSDLRELYQELILEHSKPPRNYRKLPVASHQAEGYNPLCGYHFMVYLDVEVDSIREIAFEVSGCAISKASASMMPMTAPGCGMGNVLKADVESKLSRLPSVKAVSIDAVFDPPWNLSRMSEADRLQLGI